MARAREIFTDRGHASGCIIFVIVYYAQIAGESLLIHMQAGSEQLNVNHGRTVMKKPIVAIFAAILLTGCAAALTVTGSAVPSEEKRAPISAQQVTIYQAAPEKAVSLGTVQAVASEKMNDNIMVAELVISELIKQAAALGANAIVTKPITIDPATGYEVHAADAYYLAK